MESNPVVKSCYYALCHTPDLVRYGSKPRRELAFQPVLEARLAASLRSYHEVVSYPPNQTFIGNLTPDELEHLPRPWFKTPVDLRLKEHKVHGPFGEILDQESFYGLLQLADVLQPPLFAVPAPVALRLQKCLSAHPLWHADAVEMAPTVNSCPDEKELVEGVLPLFLGSELYGYFQGDRRAEGLDDENLAASNLLENLTAKASGALALKGLLQRAAIAADEVDFIISCGEEACGDRYQRGGGGMAKAIGEMGGCLKAAGMDLKNFCAAPASALITAAALVKSGLFQNVVVVGGGSLAKLGMKFQAFLEHDLPILDDCLAAIAFLVTADDGLSPCIRLEPGAVGIVPVGAGTSDEAVFRHYLLKPLQNLGLKCRDIDRYAVELQNPEIMEYSGSGDVAAKNYRKIAALAVRSGELEKGEMKAWIKAIGMPGFAPTQGHIPSAVPYLGHALAAFANGEVERVMFLSRASLFLGRCTNLLDGVSFILERNPKTSKINR